MPVDGAVVYGAVITLLTPCLLGWWAARWLLARGGVGGESPDGLRLGLGALVGPGLTSLLAFAALELKIPRGGWWAAEWCLIGPAAIGAVLAIALRKMREPGREGKVRAAPDRGLLERALGPGLLAASVAAAAAVIVRWTRYPHGRWDAWAIWNLHARFIHRSPLRWSSYIDHSVGWTHPDYPLLLPLLVARGWILGQAEHPVFPLLVSSCFFLGLAATLYHGLASVRDRARARLATLCLLATPLVIDQAGSLYADLPLASYLLSAVVCLFLYDQNKRSGYLAPAGLAAGLAAWTKNEGLVLAPAVMLSRILPGIRQPTSQAAGRAARFGLGLALPLAAVVLFKALHPAPTDLFAGDVAARALEPGRYLQVLGALVSRCLLFSGGVISPILLAVYLILVGVDPSPGRRLAARRCGALLLLVLAAYLGAMVITPHDLTWHLGTALDRLLLQLWPSVLFLVFAVGRSPVDPPGARQR